MNIIKSIADLFRSGQDSSAKRDPYMLLSPLATAKSVVSGTIELVDLLASRTNIAQAVVRPDQKDTHQKDGAKAWHDYVTGLPVSIRGAEKLHPFSTILNTLNLISKNLETISETYGTFFSDPDLDVANVRTSALMLVGYVEASENYCGWVQNLIAHVQNPDGEMISPFMTKNLQTKAGFFGGFSGFNLTKWNDPNLGIVADIHQLQKNGTDVSVRSGDTWIDTFLGDSQLTDSQQSLMISAMRSPILALVANHVAWTQERIELYSHRQEWLIAKVALEQARLNGLDPNSPEFKKLKKMVDKYSDVISRLEQKIERLRG